MHIWGRTAGWRGLRGAFSWGPDDPETMSLAMMRPGEFRGWSYTGKVWSQGKRAPWSRKADTSVYMRMPPGPYRPAADWAEEASQVSALDKGPEKRRKGPQPKHQLGVSLCPGQTFHLIPWQHSMAGTEDSLSYLRNNHSFSKASGTSPNTQDPGGGGQGFTPSLPTSKPSENTPAGSRDSDLPRK